MPALDAFRCCLVSTTFITRLRFSYPKSTTIDLCSWALTLKVQVEKLKNHVLYSRPTSEEMGYHAIHSGMAREGG
jgi:hypothetical protein